MKYWYAFQPGHADGDRSMVDLLGGKGANLAEMCRLGIPVPPGFTLPTSLCNNGADDAAIAQALSDGIAHIENALKGPRLGHPERPLLLSVRSGARASMPGMMDSVLNIGLNQDTVEGLAAWSGDRRFAYDSYRRLLQMYGDVVCHIPRAKLEAPLTAAKRALGVQRDADLSSEALEDLVAALHEVFENETGQAFPGDAMAQLQAAVQAVFQSWNSPRAKTYRSLNNIPNDWGTAANVQAMVYGNLGATSGTGVAFTRNPATGEPVPMGEWLPRAQGEDVVAGIRTPGPLHWPSETANLPGAAQAAGVTAAKAAQASHPNPTTRAETPEHTPEAPSLKRAMPKLHAQLCEVMQQLEKHYGDVQDIEFTIQENTLYVLQTRRAKRTAQAALRIATDMATAGSIDRATAVKRVTPQQLEQLLHPQFDPKATPDPVATGLPASPGAASGALVFCPEEAVRRSEAGEDVILVRQDTSPDDIHGMHAARGVLTATGGMTSHAAVVARGMGVPCVVGCAQLRLDEAHGVLQIDNGTTTTTTTTTLKVGDPISIDGASGTVYASSIPKVAPQLDGRFATFMGWADHFRALKVRANADTPDDAATAVRLGAEGIGLCRTEHMFFEPERVRAVRRMILADNDAERRKALQTLEPMQRSDFEGIFKAMGDRPVTVRLLDPPLHEFLPRTNAELQTMADDTGHTLDEVRTKVEALSEFNPMLGHRGCRLGLSYPEIYGMQVRAILTAAANIDPSTIHPEIMVPLVMLPAELGELRQRIDGWAQEVQNETGATITYQVGTMIELPRAALVADQIANHADFFSFGTNDLTQTTMGLSRDDAGRFLPRYREIGLLKNDPFNTLDQEGVGQLVTLAAQRGRAIKDKLKLGICGEHGGDPASVHFFHKQGLHYVSCSPYRVPVARLAAAQAALDS